MKQKTHKLLSLLLAFALMLSLAPVALADECSEGGSHEWSEWETTEDPTCTEWGSQTRTCEKCGKPETQAIEPTGHDWETEVIEQPSCTDKGRRMKTCKNCGEIETEEIPARGHVYEYTDNEDGETHTKECTVCGDSETEDHDFGTSGTAAACSKCGASNPNVSAVLTVSPASVSLSAGQTRQLAVTYNGTAVTANTVWTTSNAPVATVSNTGLVTAVGVGTATVKASYTTGGRTLTATCTVTVSRNGSGVLTPSRNSVYVTSSNTGSRTGYVSVTANRATELGEYVRWSISNSNASICESQSSSSTAWGTVKDTSFNNRTTGIYVRGNRTGWATLTATLYRTGSNQAVDSVSIDVYIDNNTVYSLSPSPSNTSAVYLNYYNNGYYWDDYWDDYYWDYNYRYSRDFSVTPMYNGSSMLTTGGSLSSSFANYEITYSWTLNGVSQASNSTSRSFTLYASNSALNRNGRSNTLTCSARIYNRSTGSVYNASVSWTVYADYYYNDGYTVSATVYDTSSGYDFDERDDKGGSSIISQLESRLSTSESISYVRFSDVTDTYGNLDATTSRDYYYSSNRGSYDLRDVTFTPARVGHTGTATFGCTVYGTRGTTYHCTIRISVVEGTASSSGDIKYSARAGASVDFSASDFRNWWRDSYSRGDLDYVRFSSPSNGSLYIDYDRSNSKTVGSTNCYYSPSSSQTGINDLTFVPSSSSTRSASVRFTAYGTTNSGSNVSMSGTVSITYSGADVATITYTTTGTKSVNLSSSDFTGRYRDVMGASAPSNTTIRFRSVPSSGTLAIGSTNLSSSSISSYNFSTSSSGSNRISDVKYTPKSNSSYTETVNYDCYTGSTLRFSGTITFRNTAENTVTTNVVINYSTTGGNVAFNATDFIVGKGTAMAGSNYVVFGTPSSGSLYVGSTPLASGTKVSYVAASGMQLLGSVSYHPAAGYNGAATVPFTAYNSNGTQAASGTVNIQVTQQSTNNRTSFADVRSTDWFYNDVTTLAQANIVNGRNDGLFHPADAVNYGEALKLILLAAGYPLQTEGSGAAWAQNYLNLAVAQGLLPGSASNYTLSAPMNRTTIATVAAKALKLTPVTNEASPYADAVDAEGYVLALTKAGIVQGDASSGKQLWNGSDNLTRAQISRIVYNVYKYRNVAPGGTTSVDTSKPSWLN